MRTGPMLLAVLDSTGVSQIRHVRAARGTELRSFPRGPLGLLLGCLLATGCGSGHKDQDGRGAVRSDAAWVESGSLSPSLDAGAKPVLPDGAVVLPLLDGAVFGWLLDGATDLASPESTDVAILLSDAAGPISVDADIEAMPADDAAELPSGMDAGAGTAPLDASVVSDLADSSILSPQPDVPVVTPSPDVPTVTPSPDAPIFSSAPDGFDSSSLPDGTTGLAAPKFPSGAVLDLTAADEASVTVSWPAATDGDVVNEYRIWLDGVQVATVAAPGLTYQASGLAWAAVHRIEVRAVDVEGKVSAVNPHAEVAALAPDPATIAPAFDPTSIATFDEQIAFLWAGATPIQKGITVGALDARRIAVLRGRVIDSDGSPLPGAIIRVHDQHVLGATVSRADGRFDLVVNGGGLLVVEYERAGRLGAHRQVDPAWHDYANLPDVALVRRDPAVTTVDLLSANVQVARASVVTDSDGTRQATLVFAPGTTAALVLPDGSRHAATSLHVRATEYTVGAQGQASMPASLPTTSAYTYALELSSDEAEAVAATGVEFSANVSLLTQDFLNVPVGTAIPTGFYDRAAGLWRGSNNGVVVQVLEVTGGVAAIDGDGDGVADADAALDALGITAATRSSIGALYTAGQRVWHVALAHFSPWDLNHAALMPGPGPLPQGGAPRADGQPGGGSGRDPHGCVEHGSVILCGEQVLEERIPVVGTPLSLRYASDRGPGRTEAFTTILPLTGPTLPTVEPPFTFRGVTWKIEIAGQVWSGTAAPAPNLSKTFVWDGRDGYGRRVGGAPLAKATVGYEYEFMYEAIPWPMSLYSYFSLTGREGYTGNVYSPIAFPGRTGILSTRSTTAEIRVGIRDAFAAGLGGWELDVVHAYDRERALVSLGNGEERPLAVLGRTIELAAGAADGSLPPTYTVPDGPALGTPLLPPTAMIAGPDGSIFVAVGDSTVRRIDPQGLMHRIAGSPVNRTFSGDGGPALDAGLGSVQDIALARDGTLYLLTEGRIRRVGTDGIIHTIAGGGYNPCGGEGTPSATPSATSINCTPSGGLNGPAIELQVGRVTSIAAGPDGSLFLADPQRNRILHLSPSGWATAKAGTGANGTGLPAQNAPASTVALSVPQIVRAASDGSVYFSDAAGSIHMISPQGYITTIAGGWYTSCVAPSTCGDAGLATAARFSGIVGLALAHDGTVYVADQSFANPGRVRQIDTDGVIRPTAGSATSCSNNGPCGDGGNARAAKFYYPSFVTVAPDNRVWILDYNKLRRVTAPPALLKVGEFLIPSEDGREVWIFDAAGRHQRTLDALTNVPIWTFGFDNANRLISLTDRDGNLTKVNRDTAGEPVSIVAPGGQTTVLSLDSDGQLASVTQPSGEAFTLGYDTSGLLTSLVEPGGGTHAFAYANGRLVSDQGPAGRSKTIAQQSSGSAKTVTVTTAEGRTSSYSREALAAGEHVVRTDVTGAVTEQVIDPAGGSVTSFPDGTVLALSQEPDPRWGWAVPRVARMELRTPSGLVHDTVSTSTAVLSVPGDPLSQSSASETVTVAGATYETTWNAATRQLSIVYPDGHTETTTLDALGRVLHAATDPALSSVDYTYDPTGLLLQVASGPQHRIYAWNASRQEISVEDGSGTHLGFVRDADGRLVSASMPSKASYTFGYDAAGNLTTMGLPDARGAQTVTYDGAHLASAWARPSGATTSWTMDRDGLQTSSELPSGRTIVIGRDTSGRMVSETTSEATISFAMPDATERPSRLSRVPVGTGAAQAIDWTYDGALATRATFSGAASGTFDYTHDSAGRLVGIALSGADSATTAIMRTADDLRSKVGPFSFTRQGPASRLSAIGDGNHTINYTPDAQGRLARRTDVVGGITIYDVALTYDASGRVLAQVETVAGSATTFAYARNADQRLANVSRGGTVVEQYRWSSTGNRIGRTLGVAAEETATYDSDDRLQSRGGTLYTYNQDGMLAARGADTFSYGTRGELLAAVVGGQAVSYDYDGYGRRVRRTGPDGVTEYLYGDPEEMLLATHVRDSSGLSVLSYDETGHLIAIERTSGRYAVATDLDGTPRVVTNAAGTVVERIDRDAFGTLVTDSNPGFALPIGFGGGLADSLTGFSRLGFRDYDPDQGRFTTQDLLLFGGGSTNLYLYAGGDPLSFRDPLGLASISASAYFGVGAGFTYTKTDKGRSICVEFGTGLGWSVDASPYHEIDNPGWSYKGEAEFSAGIVGATAGFANDIAAACPHPETTSLRGRFLTFAWDTADGRVMPLSGLETLAAVVIHGAATALSAISAQGKLVGQNCAQF